MAQPSELIILGTGTSGCVPVVGCLTASPPTCTTCTSPLPENTRYNTSCLFRVGDKNLLVDCGKTFYPTALRWFPKYGIRNIDALLITHPHADAYFGLDDLRSWTLKGFVQHHIDIYCTASTLAAISNTFPYLVNSAAATGGGDLPEFVWHTFDEEKAFAVESCGGVEVTPLRVEHGKYFATGLPFWNLGFRVGDYSYISDCSGVPDTTRELIRGSTVIVMDGLKWEKHQSHFSLGQAREWCRDAFKPRALKNREGEKGTARGEAAGRAEKVWLTGFTHEIEHISTTKECLDWSEKEGQGILCRPAWDGLRMSKDGEVVL